MTPEGKVKAKVKRALKALGRDCWQFMPVQTGYGAPALDFLLSIRGRFVAIETKAPGKSLTPMQEGTKAAIEAAGGIVLIVWDEPTLALAMKIILALEFAPRVPEIPIDHIANNLDAIRGQTGPCKFTGQRIVQEEDARHRQQHLLTGLASQTLDAAARGDNGASGAPPDGRAQPSARGKNQRVTAAVTPPKERNRYTPPKEF